MGFMVSMFARYHFITNFPEGYPWYKKVFANFLYLLTGIVVHPRRNLLSHGDLIRARFLLRKGDVALWGNLREVSSLFIRGPLTHASIYVGHRQFIEAVGDGVREASMHHMFTEYDTLVILRLPKTTHNRKKMIIDVIKHAQAQIGKPYDFDFSHRSNKFFCTELVNYAYKKAGYDTKLRTLGKFNPKKHTFIDKIITASRALHPVRFAEEGNFDRVFISHNLSLRTKLSLKS